MVKVISITSVVAIVVAVAVLVWWRMQAPPANAVDRIRRDPTRPLVVCAGASVTHGRLSVDYVALLEKRVAQRFQVANAGRNGDLAFNLLKRLDAVVALQPDVVLLQIGTNDVNASFDPRVAERYRRLKKLPVLPSREFYRDNLGAIMDRLRRETSARVAVLSLPLMGEDLASVFNERVRSYNEIIRDVAAARGVPCLPLHETMAEAISTSPPPHPAPPSNRLIGLAILQRFLLFRSFDEIGARNGYRLLTDGVHLNSRGADLVADLIEKYLREAA